MKYLKMYVLISLLFCANGFGQNKNNRILLTDYLNETKIDYFKEYSVNDSDENKLLKLFKDERKDGYVRINNLFKKELEISIENLDSTQIVKSEILRDILYESLTETLDELLYSDKVIKCYKIEVKKKSIYFININNGIFIKKYSLFNEALIDAVIDKSNNEYDCNKGNVVADKVIDENLKGIKSTIFFGSSDAVSSNSAISYLNTSDGDKINIGFNYAYKDNHFLNTSIYKNSKGAYFYNNDGWLNNIGASFTYNYVIKSSQYFTKSNCEKLQKKRIEYYKEIKKDLLVFHKNRRAIDNEILKLNKEKNDLLKSTELSIDDSKRIITIDSLTKKYVKNQKNAKNALSEKEKYVQGRVNKFDSINDVLQGHYLNWYSFTGNIENQNLKLDTLNGVLLENPTKNIPKLKFSAAINWSSSNKNNKLKRGYAQVFANTTMGSFLESIQKDRKPILQEVDNELFVFDDQGNQLGRYQDLKRAYWTASLGGNLTSFYLSKNVGLTAVYNHRFALQNLDFVDFKNRYTAQVGLVFRAQKEDINKATFRILAGAEDLLYNQKTFKEASVKISVAIPINVFSK